MTAITLSRNFTGEDYSRIGKYAVNKFAGSIVVPPDSPDGSSTVRDPSVDEALDMLSKEFFKQVVDATVEEERRDVAQIATATIKTIGEELA